ncbi:RNA dependent RNA polymerase [Aspergillus glaucus CBS 516.65]|uniref:RNA-dependent RNA polymerase n=1 Tax=Aspergillus glaucus CBS 516.65 TaxID=1160497 RepID=A0A1L9VGV1_ASPGL|nr:hypothetical protein ASPGLDRAFT_67384 [Aspergillus glaucus CBS 516.65]OJJ83120.1 hypothetical protein ASPGLDRAFT_67384 [Aspergillus glaucus CBS 516.65]
MAPSTPIRNGKELHQLIESLNEQFTLDLPNPQAYSPSVSAELRNEQEQTLRWKCYSGIKRVYFSRKVDVGDLINSFEEWIVAQSFAGGGGGGFWGARRSDATTRIASRNQMNGAGRKCISQKERDARLRHLVKLIYDEIYLLNEGMIPPFRRNGPTKRRYSDDEGEYHTAPSSPSKNGEDEFPDPTLDNTNWTLDSTQSVSRTSSNSSHVSKGPKRGPGSFVERLTAPDPPSFRYDAVPPEQNNARYSFSTTTTSYNESRKDSGLGVSFALNATEPIESLMEPETQHEGSVVGHMLSQEMKTTFSTEAMSEASNAIYLEQEEIVAELLRKGPFSLERSFPPSISLRYRYELERIGRAWDVPFDRMLVGDSISFKTYDSFCGWIAGHNQRDGKLLPERSNRRAWDSAIGDFKSDKHSEVVVFSGELDWCEPDQPGILRLRLNPLKTEKTCRFHRRFGSDRFLSLTMPAPTRPPEELRLPSQSLLLRESLASWLTQNVHRCMGRTWRPFFVEEAKSKRKTKSEPRFKVEFFAIDGEDFDHTYRLPPSIAPPRQESENRTPMTIEALRDWHMPAEANMSQSNCKLFQRISIGLSKTFATAVLRPRQVLHLRDKPGQTVMNDGCALMSRGLAKEICDSLGISGNTPSCFQGRIAGAKGLWMVDRRRSHPFADDDDIWIQISDSQLKIEPHPESWQEPIDEEKLTFEVVKWSKPLHPVELNVQLLGILENGGSVKEYIAELTREGIDALYRDFAEVLQSNSNILCRSLIQKLRPADDNSGLMAYKVRRLEQWVANDIEGIVRFTEAGFAPQSFYPLRKRLGRCLRALLKQYVDELHIEVPLSTYAFCIADPYGALRPDEVHLGFSNNWQAGGFAFEDNLLDGMDVLVGRLPAHLPSDIQRRRAVWKPELRHFKDVIVFSTQGDMPLAHMLSGGDYDGDTPWICWDQKIVQSFQNSDLPEQELSYPAEHFGFTKHSVPMREIQSPDEFWQRVFTFNLTLSNLGRCTVEHEKVSYDESINSRNAKELASLLGHLVDGRKGGVHLSEQAWRQYRKRISPRTREPPAYRNLGRRYKTSNIIDYLKFWVASRQRDTVLEQLERQFPEAAIMRDLDEDLIRPWNEACQLAQADKVDSGNLQAILENTVHEFNNLKQQWSSSFRGENNTMREFTQAREAAERAKAIPPPTAKRGDHPLLHTWRHDHGAWMRVLASCAYKKCPEASFVIHAFGEILCQIKASTIPSRTVTNEILACYRFNQKAASRLTAREIPASGEEVDEFEYEGEYAIEAMCLHGTQQVLGGYWDPNDTFSVG